MNWKLLISLVAGAVSAAITQFGTQVAQNVIHLPPALSPYIVIVVAFAVTVLSPSILSELLGTKIPDTPHG